MTTERRALWAEVFGQTLHYRDLEFLETELSVSMPWYFNPSEWVVGYKILETADAGSTYLRVTRARSSDYGIRFELMTSKSGEAGRTWTGFRRELKETLARIANRAEDRTEPGIDWAYPDAVVTLSEMIEAGMHFGTSRRNRNPKMTPYVATERNGLQIIDLRLTLDMVGVAYEFVRQTVADGGTVMFVGTKKSSRDLVKRSAASVNMPYVNARWPGGMLTNFRTISGRIDLLADLEGQRAAGWPSLVTKKEQVLREREMRRLERLVGGVRSMRRLPDALWVVDPRKEHLAVKEARSLGIPVVALADTDADPSVVDYLIPGNDDGTRSAGLMTSVVGDAVAEGLMQRGYSLGPVSDEPAPIERRAGNRELIENYGGDLRRTLPRTRNVPGRELEGPGPTSRVDPELELLDRAGRVAQMRAQGEVARLAEALTALATLEWAVGRGEEASASVREALRIFAAATRSGESVDLEVVRQAGALDNVIRLDAEPEP